MNFKKRKEKKKVEKKNTPSSGWMQPLPECEFPQAREKFSDKYSLADSDSESLFSIILLQKKKKMSSLLAILKASC